MAAMEASAELLNVPAPGEQSPGQQGGGASEGNTHPLTATAQEGLQGLEARTDAIDKMIEEILQQGDAFFEGQKAKFVQNMQQLKQQIRAYSDNTTAQTIKDSDQHQNLMIRLQQSQGLIEQLGIQVHHHQEGSA